MKLTAFDYVPPFRGRAVHMLKRDAKFNELGIDFEELERRKAAEYAKLDCVARYCRTRTCRQLEILQYFGDPNRERCGNCDNCGPAREKAAQKAHHAGVVEAVRMVLSGVARTHGRVGKGLVAKMLTGSQSKDVTGLRLDKLSTFGLLADLKQTEAVALIDALITAGLVDQIENQKFRPLVQLSERGADVMRGAAPLTESLALDAAIVLKLEARNKAAKVEAPAVQPAISTTPSTTSTPRIESAPVPRIEEPAVNVSSQPNYYWTWKVLSSGLSVDDCRHIRGLGPEAILDHALRAVENGLAVDLGWFLSPEQVAAIESVVGQEPPERIRPLLSKLPKDIRYEHIQLFLRCRLAAAAES